MNAHGHFEEPSNPVHWGEIAPCEHILQIYTVKSVFLDALEGFIAGGLRNNEGVLVIATQEHLAPLDRRLSRQALDLGAARAEDRYIDLDAAQTLDTFVGDGLPDEERFQETIGALLERAGRGGRRIRVFGEMAALMWTSGRTQASMRVERLWNQVCHSKKLSLFCAYPRAGFTHDAEHSMRQICGAHSRVIRG